MKRFLKDNYIKNPNRPMLQSKKLAPIYDVTQIGANKFLIIQISLLEDLQWDLIVLSLFDRELKEVAFPT